jgi:hypothetical protein
MPRQSRRAEALWQSLGLECLMAGTEANMPLAQSWVTPPVRAEQQGCQSPFHRIEGSVLYGADLAARKP